MALDIRRITDDIIEVEETTMSFTETTKQSVYYNTKVNEKYMHPAGKKVSLETLLSNSKGWREMDFGDIGWMHKYYIPRIGERIA